MGGSKSTDFLAKIGVGRKKTDFAAVAGRSTAVPICLIGAPAMELRVGPGQPRPGRVGSEIPILNDHERGFPVAQNVGIKIKKT